MDGLAGGGGGGLQWPALTKVTNSKSIDYKKSLKFLSLGLIILKNLRAGHQCFLSILPPFGQNVNIYRDDFPTRPHKIAAAKINTVRLEQNPF